jgi:tRNA pseudouridine55 synthase
VVAAVRRRLSRQAGHRVKTGHAGTLDPFATGLLLVMVGRATRAQRFLAELPKTYRAVARLGWTSDTGDPEGQLIFSGHVPERLVLPEGRLMQRPPAYSAVKVGGEPLYRRARRGEAMEGDARPVTVYRANLLWSEGEHAAFEIECSAGTYVRQLMAGLGDAYCEQLERTAVGPFRLEDADPDVILPLADALSFLPERSLAADEAVLVSHGRAVPADGDRAAGDAVRLTSAGELLAIGERHGDELKPVVVFRS